ncbi:MAG: hypothetical protein NVV74_20640 [Magnetospirillum sp.]|nr:hypothetical protein [Magnetospirillum sp.]
MHPVGGNLVQSKEAPGVPVTGITNGVPIAEQLNTFKALKPIKKLLVLYNVREPNSVLTEKEVAQWAEKNAVTVVSSRVAPGTDTLKDVLANVASGSQARHHPAGQCRTGGLTPEGSRRCREGRALRECPAFSFPPPHRASRFCAFRTRFIVVIPTSCFPSQLESAGFQPPLKWPVPCISSLRDPHGRRRPC